MSLEDTLTRIADLLDAHGAEDWGRAFRRSRSEYMVDPEEAKRKIRSVYGGMGSFNDLVLHSPNGAMLSAENNELNRLRHQLYELCR